MGRKSGSLKAKRTNVPSFWKIPKKEKRYFVRTEPGPHPRNYSYPLLVVVRDLLHLTRNRKEALLALNEGKIFVDGKVVKSPGFPVGLMDVIDVPSVKKSYRIVPSKGGLRPVEIPSVEKDVKICLVRAKRMSKGSKPAFGLHDGRVIGSISNADIRMGDACLVKLPSHELQTNFRLSKGGLALLVRGERSGEIATIEDLKPGTFSKESIATIRLADGTASELPTEILMPLGTEMPSITMSAAGK